MRDGWKKSKVKRARVYFSIFTWTIGKIRFKPARKKIKKQGEKWGSLAPLFKGGWGDLFCRSQKVNKILCHAKAHMRSRSRRAKPFSKSKVGAKKIAKRILRAIATWRRYLLLPLCSSAPLRSLPQLSFYAPLTTHLENLYEIPDRDYGRIYF